MDDQARPKTRSARPYRDAPKRFKIKNRHTPQKLDRAAIPIAMSGGILIGLAIFSYFSMASLSQNSPKLEQVASAGLSQAANSLDSGRAAELIKNAKSCTAPLAYLTVIPSGMEGGIISFRSGGYLSPTFKIGSKAELVALPFPAPYETGMGKIVIESHLANGAKVYLSPG